MKRTDSRWINAYYSCSMVIKSCPLLVKDTETCVGSSLASYFVLFSLISLVSFDFVFISLISFRFCWFRFVSFRFRWFRFVSFLFRFALYRYPKRSPEPLWGYSWFHILLKILLQNWALPRQKSLWIRPWVWWQYLKCKIISKYNYFMAI